MVSISPEMAALAPERKQLRPLSGRRPRPPARRMKASGRRKRNTATIRRIWSPVSGARCPKGVPGMGFSMLTGTERIPSSRSESAMSTWSSGVSPMPTIPPLHTVSPAAWAAFMAASFWSKVWVVHTLGKLLREVSRLLWIRVTPASFSFSY